MDLCGVLQQSRQSKEIKMIGVVHCRGNVYCLSACLPAILPSCQTTSSFTHRPKKTLSQLLHRKEANKTVVLLLCPSISSHDKHLATASHEHGPKRSGEYNLLVQLVWVEAQVGGGKEKSVFSGWRSEKAVKNTNMPSEKPKLYQLRGMTTVWTSSNTQGSWIPALSKYACSTAW